MLVDLKDVSNLIEEQQSFYDQMYLDAVETSYSHEQMTPLNSILSFSQVIKKQVSNSMRQWAEETREVNPIRTKHIRN